MAPHRQAALLALVLAGLAPEAGAFHLAPPAAPAARGVACAPGFFQARRCTALAAEESPYEAYMKQRAQKEGGGGAPAAVAAEVVKPSEPAAAVAKEEAAPAPVAEAKVEVKRSTEEQLALSVKAETEKMSARSKRMASLTSRLQRSVARKMEVEDMVAAELADVSEKLVEELAAEKERRSDLDGLLRQFEAAISAKQANVETEEALLSQMQAVKAQVKEDSIRAQIETAMAKKADLISIEVILLEDMSDCREQLVAELAATVGRMARIDGVVAALPSPGDKARARAYDWEDIQGLQDLLLESVQSILDSDTKVAALRTKFEDAVRQKREVLGELPAPSTVIEVVGGGGEGATQGLAALRGRIDLSAVSALSTDELQKVAGVNSKQAAVALGKTVTVGATSLGEYLKSPKAQSLASTFVDLVDGTANYFKALGDSLSTARKVFDASTLPGEEITSFDKMFKTARDGVESVRKSEEVKAQLEKVKQQQAALPQTAKQVTSLAGEALKGASENAELTSAVKEALTSVQSALLALAGLGTKAVGGVAPTGRMLPPTPPAGGAKGAAPIDVGEKK